MFIFKQFFFFAWKNFFMLKVKSLKMHAKTSKIEHVDCLFEVCVAVMLCCLILFTLLTPFLKLHMPVYYWVDTDSPAVTHTPVGYSDSDVGEICTQRHEKILHERQEIKRRMLKRCGGEANLIFWLLTVGFHLLIATLHHYSDYYTP